MGKKPGKKEEKQTRQCCAVISLGRSWHQHAVRSQWEGKHPEPKSRVDERKVVATVKLLGGTCWKFMELECRTVTLARLAAPARGLGL